MASSGKSVPEGKNDITYIKGIQIFLIENYSYKVLTQNIRFYELNFLRYVSHKFLDVL